MKYIINISLFLFCSYFSIIFLDLGVYYFIEPEDYSFSYRERIENSGERRFDRRDRWTVISDFQAKGIKANRTLSFMTLSNLYHERSGDGLFPLGSISNAFTVLCNERGDYATYMSDSYGFPNPPGTWSLKEAESVMIVGDSYGISSCVSRDEALDKVVRSRYPKTLVVAAGGGYLQYYLAALREYGRPTEPKNVFLLLFSNDIPGETFKTDPFLSRYNNPIFTQRLIERQPEIDRFWERLLETQSPPSKTDTTKKLPSYLDVLLFRHLRDTLGLAYGRDTTNYGMLREIILQIKHEVTRWNGNLTVLYLPSFGEIYFDANVSRRAGVARTIRETGVVFHDLTDVFKARGQEEEFFYYRNSHYNVEGYRLIGDAILGYLSPP